MGRPRPAEGKVNGPVVVGVSVQPSDIKEVAPARDEARLIRKLRSLKGERSPRGARIAQALDILEKTKSPRVRNAAALALADLRAHNAKDKLVDLLTRSDTRGSRGTLLYALEQLGAVVPVAILADIIIDESYEAREEALELIVTDRIQCSAEQLSQAEAKLEAATTSADAERLQAIKRALEYLRMRQRAPRDWRP